ncbi:MAG: SMC-Scp complex subunit ScpB [Daejeonella sp.]
MIFKNAENHIEALIFASEKSITIQEILPVINLALENAFTENDVLTGIRNIKAKYEDDSFAIQLADINGGFQFLTKKIYHKTINQLQIQRSKKKLSQAALETLAIIAYKQPATKLDIEHIRGVNCDYSIQKLLEKELIAIIGKANSVGKPLLYSTSSLFMDYFGINATSELPQLTDIISSTNEIGKQQ